MVGFCLKTIGFTGWIVPDFKGGFLRKEFFKAKELGVWKLDFGLEKVVIVPAEPRLGENTDASLKMNVFVVLSTYHKANWYFWVILLKKST